MLNPSNDIKICIQQPSLNRDARYNLPAIYDDVLSHDRSLTGGHVTRRDSIKCLTEVVSMTLLQDSEKVSTNELIIKVDRITYNIHPYSL